jgi:hypothetical protein
MMARTLTHRFALLGIVLLAGAASPTTSRPFAMVDPVLPPEVIAPPAASPTGFTPAPMPDIELNSGIVRDPGPAKVGLAPSLFNEHPTYQGDGFTPNSTVQGEQTKRIRPAAGFNLSVPLQ